MYEGGESIGEGDCDGGGSVGGSGDVYNGRAEPVLVSLLDLYSEDKEISVCDSRPSSSPTYIVTDYSSTSYCPKEKVFDVVLRNTFYSSQLF